MRMSIESNHNTDELGPLTAGGNPPVQLVSLADLVRHVMKSAGPPHLPLRAAATKVIDTLEHLPTLPSLYLTERADFARAVTPDLLVRQGKEQRGPLGLLAVLRDAWVTHAKGPEVLSATPLARLAMREEVAKYLFGFGYFWEVWSDEAAQTIASEEAGPGVAPSWIPLAPDGPVLPLVSASSIERQGSRIVQPVGGLWSNHKKGAKWSDVEKAAMRKMRANGLSDAEIATAAKCTRQVVGQQIGSKQADRARQNTERVNGQLQA